MSSTKLIILSLLIHWIALSWSSHVKAASFNITNASGGSYTEVDTNGNVTLYGGIAGTCTSPSSNSTCNTCTDTTLPAVACNPTNVHPSLLISITVQTGTALNNSRVQIFTGSTFADKIQVGIDATVTAAASQSLTIPIAFDWGDLCQADNNFTDSCTPEAATSSTGESFESSRRIFVGIDENSDNDITESETESFPVRLHHVDKTRPDINEQAVCTSTDGTKFGSCGFILDVGGDQKLFIRQIIGTSSTGSPPRIPSGAPDWYGLAFFFADQTGAPNPANVSTASSNPIIKTYDVADYSIDATLDGFENYREYCLIMGNMNKSQNIFYLTTGGVVGENCGTPSEVVGLLDDKSCFISTAAYGSNLAEQVETFRQFRNRYLIPYQWGRSFVQNYYKYSPPLAHLIAESEIARLIVRGLLYPVYIFSWLSLNFGFLFALLAAIVSLILIQSVRRTLRHSMKWMIFIVVVALFSTDSAEAQIFPRTKKAQHPSAEADGLVKIDKDGVYIYKPEPLNVKHASHVRIGMVSNPEVESEICNFDGTNCQTVNFNDLYEGASGMGFEYLYEYFLMTESNVNFGKLGIQAGISVSYAQGQGRLVSDLTVQSIESFTFLTAPLFLGGIYRFQYQDRQILVPYAGGGGVYALLAEKREDQSNVNAIAAPGFYGFGGALLNLSNLDRDLGSDLESEYDIKNLWLSAEYKFLSVNSDAFVLENGYVQAGLGFDF